MEAVSVANAGERAGRDAAGRNWLALGAVAGPVLFTLAWAVLGFVSTGYTLFGQVIAPYSAVSQPVSGLGLGVTAPWMNAAFVVSGALLLAGVVGSVRAMAKLGRGRQAAAMMLLGLTPVGAMTCGVFTLESFLPHFVGFILAACVPVVSFLVVGMWLRGLPRWRGMGVGLMLASPLTLALIVLFFFTFDPMAAASGGIAGLTQRVLITEVLGMFAVMGAVAWRRP